VIAFRASLRLQRERSARLKKILLVQLQWLIDLVSRGISSGCFLKQLL
jgi:Flp pilus assembly protein TadB